ncbi:Thermolabile hemolysin [Zancudomyces culisetae]|uniref:Thermolabile hemolysin n=1 Tax=Zancudomyces culisetae TaxID=1213189 RepID=A0A1R1PXY2_ZANCU|nr:Thermolabile hemolysin [Zancudomyces culisetae]|eukprot:OMH85782.1 Thermolabile hemolysin [Zancudomyces culisetae]
MFGFDTLLVFGDSNSDIGNVRRVSKGLSPIAGSYDGRFSDGPVWCDNLVRIFNLKTQNYAYGNATTNNENIAGTIRVKDSATRVEVPGVKQQIAQYLDSEYNVKENGASRDTELFAIFVGSNDLTSRLYPGSYNITREMTEKELIESQAECIEMLIEKAKVKHLLIFTTRPREDYPGIRQFEDSQVSAARDAALEFNRLLKIMVEEKTKKYPTVNLILYDIHKLMKQLALEPTRYGLHPDVFTPIIASKDSNSADDLTPGQDTDCSKNNRLFWDTFHISQKAQMLATADIIHVIAQNFWKRNTHLLGE